MAKKQPELNLKTSEEFIITISIIIIGIMTITSFGFLIYFYLFIPILVADFTVLIRKKRISETLLRILIFVNVIAIAASVYVITGATAPWMLQ